ncbi:MAG: 6-bladed beta-propeller [Bacteroidota bacterium]
MYKTFVFALAAISFSCASTTSEINDVGVPANYVIDLEGAIEENDLEVGTISLTPLTQPLDFDGFSDHLKLKVWGNIFYVFDIRQQFLMVYDSLGHHLQKIGGKGNGPNELNRVIDFAVGADEVAFLKPAGNNMILNHFGKDGKHIRNDNIPVSAVSLGRFDSGDYVVFTGWNNQAVPDKLYRIDQASANFTTFFPHEFDEPKISIGDSDNFTNLNDRLYFLESLKPEIFQIREQNELELFAYIDLGDLDINNDFWSMEPMKAAEMLMKSAFFHCRYFWVTEDFIILEGFVNNGNGKGQVFLTVHQIHSGVSKAKALEPGSIDQLLMNIFYIEDNYIYSLGDGYAIKTLGLEEEIDADIIISDTTYYIVKSEIKF